VEYLPLPIGERLLRQQLPGKLITSAGIYGLEGCPADEAAQDVAWRHGLSLDGHIARRLTHSQMEKSDLILVMEPQHLHFIAATARKFGEITSVWTLAKTTGYSRSVQEKQ
jgi:protein-tyrosine phosphatase